MEQLALTIHISTATLLIAVVIYTDHLGLWWMLGKRETLSAKALTILHRSVWLGLIIMILSGGTMFLSLHEYLLTVPAFYIKMGFVATLLINAYFIGRFLHIATKKSFASLTQKEKAPLFISGAVSTICWSGVITAAFSLGL